MKSIVKVFLIIVQIVLVLFIFRELTETGYAVLEPVDLPDPYLGPENASIVIVEYSEFECPYCSAAAGGHKALIEGFKERNPEWEAPVPGLEQMAREGKIKFVFKHFPLDFHENAQMAAEASEAAHAQGKFWEYHDALFATGGKFGYNTLVQIAEDLNLDIERFEKELNGNVYTDSVKRDRLEGIQAGVKGTPAFIINGKLISGAQPLSVFEEIVEQANMKPSRSQYLN